MPIAKSTDGLGVHYRVVGERGPWLVFVQGLSLSGRFWFDTPDRMAERFGARAIVLDNRGTGRSERPPGPFSMGQMADDVRAVLDDAGCDRATVVGISMGGMISQHVAIRHAPKVEGLVLLATTAGLPLGRLPGPTALQLLARIPFTKGRKGGELAARLLLPPSKQSRFEEFFSRWPEAFAQDPQDPRTFYLQLGAISLHSTGAKLGAIAAPTVVMAGREDILVPPVNSQRIAAKIPGAELELIADVGHAIPAEDPMAIERAIGRVWARLGRVQ
ncbi:MAG: alpha/beta fold hydrolase [Myxococcales bacterium]|nr:alpha/beta fold hydrolase [Myxococcales bacterium]